MKVRIGISTTDKLIEIEVDDPKAFKKEMERAVSEGGLGWFTDSKGRTVGIPARSVAFIELEDTGDTRTVGFTPAKTGREEAPDGASSRRSWGFGQTVVRRRRSASQRLRRRRRSSSA